MSVQTVSEELFESFCTARGIRCERIPTAASRTADYSFTLNAGVTVIAEVKQLDPGPEDRRLSRQMAEHGYASGVYVPGARVRQQITDGKAQLRRIAKNRHPALLIIYNNTGLGSGYFTEHDVLTAMYGEEVIEFTRPDDWRVRSEVVAHRFGGRRSVTPTANTTLSAVAVLHPLGTVPAELDMYHNCYAALPFNPDWLRDGAVRHFGVTVGDGHQFQEWHAV